MTVKPTTLHQSPPTPNSQAFRPLNGYQARLERFNRRLDELIRAGWFLEGNAGEQRIHTQEAFQP